MAADPIVIDLGPVKYAITVWRGARRFIEFNLTIVDPEWVAAHPNPTDEEFAAAPTVPFDLTGYTGTSAILSSRSGDAADTVLVELGDADIDFVDREAGTVRVWLQVPNSHPKTSNWYLVITGEDEAPFPVAYATITAIGQTR